MCSFSRLFHSIACFVDGFDEESRMLRRSLMRYMNLALILVLRSISSAVKQRFPTLDHVVEAGFMTHQEKELFNAVPATEFNTYWIPCTWFVFRLQEAAKKGKLLNAYALETVMRVINQLKLKKMTFNCKVIKTAAANAKRYCQIERSIKGVRLLMNIE